MPRRIVWTPEKDATIIAMRAAGGTWDAIVAAIGHTRWTIIERGNLIGAALPAPVPKKPEIDLSRDPLAAGHPVSWGAIIAGTSLADSAYPHPVFR